MNTCPQCGNQIPMGSNSCQLCGYVMPEDDFYNVTTNDTPQTNYYAEPVNQVQVQPTEKKKKSSAFSTSVFTFMIFIIVLVIFFFANHSIYCSNSNVHHLIIYTDDTEIICLSWPIGNCPNKKVMEQGSWSYHSFAEYIDSYADEYSSQGGTCRVRH